MHRKIEALLKDKIGLDVKTIGEASIKNAVKHCLNASGCSDLNAYYQALISSDVELKRLVEAVVIPETWFFRDDVPFNVLTSNVNNNWLDSEESDRKLKVLSMPCSTGEEPYTIAMALDKIGFPEKRVEIDAIDISQQSLDKAKKGVYRPNSFRSDDLSFRDDYFTKVSEGYRLKSNIRRRVNFQQGNLLRDDLSQFDLHYDVIFCRNLLIYFDSQDQQTAVRKLYNMLADDGVLFVGHAEANNNVNQLFRSLRIRGSFSFVKKNEYELSELNGNYDEKVSKFSTKHRELPTISHAGVSLNPVNGNKKTVGVHSADNKPFSDYHIGIGSKVDGELDEQVLISKAHRLADEGRLDEAEATCQQLIINFSSADAFYLLGVVYDATNRSGMAESMFRKAIYLMPNHIEALIHLALHVEINGSVEEALSLRRRAERANQ